MKIRRAKNPLPILGALAAVLLGLFLPFLPPAHSLVIPSQCSVSSANAGQVAILTITSGNPSTSTTLSMGSCGALGELMIFALYFTVPVNTPSFQAVLTDNASDTWTQQNSALMTRCTANSLPGQCKGPYSSQMFIFSTSLTSTAATAGHLTITVAPNSGNFPYNSNGLMQWEFWQNVNPTVTSSCAGSFGVDPNGQSAIFSYLNGNNPTAVCNIPIAANGIAYGMVLYTQSGSGAPTFTGIGGITYDAHNADGISLDTNHCSLGSFASAICQSQGGAMINGNANSTNSVGYAITSGSASNSMTILVVSFGGPVSGQQGGTNIDCIPACPAQGGINTSGSAYLTVNNLYYYSKQNGFSIPGQMIDFTSETSAVHCTKSTCYLWATVYIGDGFPPSPAHPLVQSSFTKVFAIKNGTVNQVLDVNPGIQIGGGLFYAIAIFSNSTASRGSGASGTGVSVYQATWSNQMFQFALTSNALPTSFNGQGVAVNNPLYFVAQLAYAISFLTTTSTLTIGGTATTTTTSTSTITTIDSSFFSQNANWPFILLFLFVPAMIFLGATKNIYGGMFGFVMGAAICLFAHIIEPFIFTGIIIGTVALAYVAREAG